MNRFILILIITRTRLINAGYWSEGVLANQVVRTGLSSRFYHIALLVIASKGSVVMGISSWSSLHHSRFCFANILYIREDGLLAHYFPDFMVKIGNIIYVVETKAEKDVNSPNVKLKQTSTIDWINKVNELDEDNRMGCIWKYVLLGEKTFYSMSDKGATTEEILEYNLMSKSKIKGTLTRFTSESDDKY